MIKYAAMFLAGQAIAASIPATTEPRAAQICLDESTGLTCYTQPDNVPQNVAVADVTYVAAYLRSYGKQTKAGRLFTMAAVDAPDCAEWSLYSRGTVAAYAKHVDSSIDSSVLFEDIANTIDGGAGATDAQKAAAIIGCLTDGGSLGVQANLTRDAYKSATYTAAGYQPSGILIKIVNSTPPA